MKLGKVYFNLWVRVFYYNNKYILALRRDPKLRKMSMTIMVLTSPYILARWLVLACLDWLCVPLVRRANRLEQAKAFAHELAVVVIAKNEGRYIREWVEYHKLLGVTKFYFYDNDSEDNTREILRPYVDSGLVNYRFLSGKARQLDAYNDALVRHKDECRYMAFIDMDEFIVPTTPWKPIVEVVKEIIGNSGGGASGVGINWALFGSSGLAETPRGGVIKNFNHRGENRAVGNAHIKTVCNPRRVACYISPHYPLYKLGCYSVGENGERLYVWFCDKRDYKHLRINHYYTKSKEQFIEKASRGLADRVGEYRMEQFFQYDLNEIEDNSMSVYVDALKKILGERLLD